MLPPPEVTTMVVRCGDRRRPQARRHRRRHPSAIEHAIRVHAMDGYLLLVGPRRDGQLLEIGYNPTADRVFHAMPVRPKYL